ncbi:MAG: cryptochrome/photolyase family protein [Solirubrobacteraceae bacterium]
MGHTALILGDQLSHANPALEGATRVLMIESRAALGRLRCHRARRHLVLSSMRHLAAELREAGVDVVYEQRDTMHDALAEHDGVVCAAPNDAGARARLAKAGVRFVASTQFLTDPERFADWAGSRGRLVMEDFYSDQRRRFDVLMEPDGKPAGGRFNYDKDNRRPPKEGLSAPAPYRPEEDEIDLRVRRDLDALDLPEFGECLRQAMTDVRESGYAHPLMVLGNLQLLLGVKPWESVEWFRSAFVDGAEWVMAPNAVGMATWADGGAMMTKPYAACGRYIDRMSRFCGDCRFTPTKRTGDDACPVTQLYWDFMASNHDALASNRRMRNQVRMVERFDADELAEVRAGRRPSSDA